MRLKTYRAASIAEALGRIKRDLGPSAVILHTRTFKHGGVFGIGARKMVEITATDGRQDGVNVPRRAPSRQRVLRPETQADGELAGESRSVAAASIATAVQDAAEFSSAVRPPMQAVRTPVEPSLAGAASQREQPARMVPPSPPGRVEPARIETPPASARDAELAGEIASLKRLVGQALHRSGRGPGAPTMPDALFRQYMRLIEAEVAEELADQVVGAVRDELDPEDLECDQTVRDAVLRRLAALIPAAAETPRPKRAPDGRPLTIALVGPTGVGKTTTIAKLAASYKLRYGKSVGVITSDTYRIAAVEQLRTYANIIGVPIEVAMTPSEMTAACRRLSQRDVLLIDTAGRSQNDQQRVSELSAFIRAADPHETHLVLSCAASERVMLAAAERFAEVEPDRVILTKLDETVGYGVLVNAAHRIGTRLSFVTTGQEVPDHIEPGRADRLARLVLEGGPLQ